MTTDEKEKIQQAKKMLAFLLTLDDRDIIMATIESVIEILEDLG